jgi:ABC-2 type transport system ATP-binding protein
MHAISARDLTKCYGELIAVDHISFNVEKGEIFGFLGPNGAGKTTTIKMLTGLAKPTEGEAIVNGYNILENIVEVKRSIGVVPETSNLYDELTAEKNLLFMAQLYGVEKRRRMERVAELLKLFKLEEKRYVRFAALSKGMKRSLTIAAALVHNPEVLFLDEPTSGLDVMNARSLRNLIKELRERGVTIFLTTHYIEEADLLCDRIAIIVRGKIKIVDTPSNLKSLVKGKVIELSFDRAVDKKLLVVEGVEFVEGDKARYRISTSDQELAIRSLFKFAESNNLRILSINTILPSLEDSFVKIAGVEKELMLLEKESKGGLKSAMG